MPDIFGFVVWSIGICRKKKKLKQAVMHLDNCTMLWLGGRIAWLISIYLDTVEENILLVYFAV